MDVNVLRSGNADLTLKQQMAEEVCSVCCGFLSNSSTAIQTTYLNVLKMSYNKFGFCA